MIDPSATPMRKIDHEDGTLAGLALSPDGKQVLISTWGGQRQVKGTGGKVRDERMVRIVDLFDLATGKQLWRRPAATTEERMGQVVISPDGRIYAVGIGSLPARIEVGEVATGKVLGVIKEVPALVGGLAFSTDGKRLVSAAHDAIVWDVASGKSLHQWGGGAMVVAEAVFGGGGRFVLTGDNHGLVRLWEVARGEARDTVSSYSGVRGMTYHEGSRTLARWGHDRTILLVELAAVLDLTARE